SSQARWSRKIIGKFSFFFASFIQDSGVSHDKKFNIGINSCSASVICLSQLYRLVFLSKYFYMRYFKSLFIEILAKSVFYLT
ncbi:MAG: hypothetical protein ACI9U5_001473, partial [Colwellia sp.]